jgi:hypothetical protein
LWSILLLLVLLLWRWLLNPWLLLLVLLLVSDWMLPKPPNASQEVEPFVPSSAGTELPSLAAADTPLTSPLRCAAAAVTVLPACSLSSASKGEAASWSPGQVLPS